MRPIALLALALAVLTVHVLAHAQPPSNATSQQQRSQRRVAPPPNDLLDAFVETAPYTNLALFREYDVMNKIKLPSPTVLTTKKPGKHNAEEARARSPLVVGERWANGILPVATWSSPAKVQRVDFLIGGEGIHAMHPAETYQSPAVLAGGDTRSLEQIANLVGEYDLPVTVRIIYQDGQVWMATFVARNTAKK